MTQRQSRFFGDLQRLRRLRWVWTIAAILSLLVGLGEIVLADGSRLHVVLGVLFLVMSLGWGLQAWGGFRYRPNPSVAEDERPDGLEALGLRETPEAESPARDPIDEPLPPAEEQDRLDGGHRYGVLAWDDEWVTGRDGARIHEGNDDLVLVHDAGFGFPRRGPHAHLDKPLGGL
jgi:hypothetical protein